METCAETGVEIRRLGGEAEAWACAEIMASTDPWVRYGRTREMTFVTVSNPLAESYVAIRRSGPAGEEEVVGVVVLAMAVPLIKGYVCGLAVKAGYRGRGIGTALLRAAEERIFAVSPNVFICVTSFNEGAQRLYERLGYRQVGVISDFALPGVDEYLLRKTLGPLSEFVARE